MRTPDAGDAPDRPPSPLTSESNFPSVFSRREFVGVVAKAAVGVSCGLFSFNALAGDSQRSETELRRLLNQAIQAGAKSVRIPPGVYRVNPEPGGKAHLYFKDVHDLEIDGSGVELIMTDVENTSLVYFQDCARVKVRGLTVDCDPILFTQGVVTAAHPDQEWIDVTIESGYETKVKTYKNLRPMSVFDRQTREWKFGVPDIFLERVEQKDPKTWRIFPMKHSRGGSIAIGDLAAIPASGAPGFTCRGCADMVFEECTIYQSGSMAFHEHGGGGNTTLRRCRVLKRPDTSRLLSTNADGFHCKNMAKGPTVEGCIFEGMHDDGINIHGMFSRVANTTKGKEVLVVPIFEDPNQIGDLVEFFSWRTGLSRGAYRLVEKKVIAPENKARAEAFHGMGAGWLFQYTLDHPLAADRFDAMASLSYCGSNYRIQGCEFRPLRYRAILVRTYNGLIENNRITGCGNDGVALVAHPFTEGPVNKRVTVRNNIIRHVGMIPYQHIGCGIRVATDVEQKNVGESCVLANELIVIENNTIADTARDGICVVGAQNVSVQGNRISDVGIRSFNAQERPLPIRVLGGKNVTVQNNTVLGKQ